MEHRFHKSLLIGTTGMLGAATCWAVARSDESYVVARRASAGDWGGQPLDLDWCDTDGFIGGLRNAGALDGADLAVLWIHRSGAIAAQRVVRMLTASPCLIVQVEGSQALRDLSASPPFVEDGQARRITVTLGAVSEGGTRRWLNWDEISAGTIAAIEARESRVLGSLTV